eukprot:CAMPEP_0176224924 /NCGR_PEP_ID=MMETSP0121_2-20121125/21502_1 /TAXON_ID=160619 /ORGANISM="Kryptoperidinium foliaceum, Strain CCMP 1326" /LENGTH=138 /DNA_ID=CAMNT_0017564187 /DNA_START=67 /DNA_END=481 /DNA_ORIENTATION=+
MAEEERQIATRIAPTLSIWSIGQGFEGTASDWTEYVVWLLGFISLIWWTWHRNVQALPDDSELSPEVREALGHVDSEDDGEGSPAEAPPPDPGRGGGRRTSDLSTAARPRVHSDAAAQAAANALARAAVATRRRRQKK